MLISWLRRRRLRQQLQLERLSRVKKQREERDLMTGLMNLESARLELQLKHEQVRAEHELKKTQWEIENAEQVQKAKEAQTRLNAEMKERRREYLKQAREAKAAKAAVNNQSTNECRVCKGGCTDLTVEEITWHHRGHNYGPSLFN